MNVQEEIKIINILEYLRGQDKYCHEYFEEIREKSYEYFMQNTEKCKEDVLKIFPINFYNNYYIETAYLLNSDIHIKNARKSLNGYFSEKVSGTSWYQSILSDVELRCGIKATLEGAVKVDSEFISNFIKSRSVFFRIFNPKTVVRKEENPDSTGKVRSTQGDEISLQELYNEIGKLASIHYNAVQTLEMFLLSRGHAKVVPTDIIKQLALEVDNMDNEDTVEDLTIDKLKELKMNLQTEFNQLMEVK